MTRDEARIHRAGRIARLSPYSQGSLMYKLLLCWRYLRTRYIALASIISVMLGVATMIVVNSVMAGFSSEMQNRIHGILSDVVFESRSIGRLRRSEVAHGGDPPRRRRRHRGMTPTVVVPAMLNFQVGGETQSRGRSI